MIYVIFVCAAVFIGVITFFFTKNFMTTRLKILMNEHEFLQKTAENERQILKNAHEMKILTLENEITSLQNAAKSAEERARNEKISLQNEYANLIKNQKEHNQDLVAALQNAANLTREEAKNELLEALSRELTAEKARLISRSEKEAREEAKMTANFILAQSVAKYAGEFAVEKLTDTVELPNDDFKGKIIGKDGRNIKVFERVTGVDVLIDNPASITISNFSLYRRAIAVKTMQTLIQDGRIQPARIESTHAKIMAEMESQILENGRNAAHDIGIFDISDEILTLLGRMKYRTSYGQNALLHSIEVAKLAQIIAQEIGGPGTNPILAARAGLLHDIGKALDQENDGDHVSLGFAVCEKNSEPPAVLNAIMAHHGHEDAKSIEAACACAADALSAARPGARIESMEKYIARMKNIERIANSKRGVKQAYAINAGRELRVIARSEMLSDEAVVVLARDIAKEIEKNVAYPGTIKVNVIRETVAVHFAQ